MAFTTDDFSKIWASTSPLTPYEFSDSNYAQGWNFVGSTPPARQMWDFLQKRNDEKTQWLYNNKLSLSGGTMTGNPIIKMSSDSNRIQIAGGNSADGYAGGARLTLYGKYASSGDDAIGGFALMVYNDSDGRKTIIGKPDGTLTWNGQSIPERSYGINLTSLAAGENTYTFTINTNGTVIFAKRGANCSCHMVDYWTSNSVKLFSTGTDPITITKSANSDSVTITNTYSSAVAIKIINGGTL